MFGENLRKLANQYDSISELSRQLGINRTQFNRYLSGESFPRPDVLDRICTFFKVDARILLEPVDKLRAGTLILMGPVLEDFVGPSAVNLPEDEFPSGFYRFSRRSFASDTLFIMGLVFIFRLDGATYVRGYEAKEAMRQQGLDASPQSREFRGFLTRHETGIAMIICRRNARTSSFNYLGRVSSFENNFWVGYTTRTVSESVSGTRAERVVFEHLSDKRADIMTAARTAGLVPEEKLIPFHRRLLQPAAPFR